MTDYAGFDPASMHGVIIVKPTLLSYSIYLPTTLTIEQTYHLRFSCKELRAISSQRQKALCYSWAVLRDERDNRDKRDSSIKVAKLYQQNICCVHCT